MSIDARIPLSVFSNTPDVGAIYQRSMMLKSLAQRQKMDQMQMDEEKRKLDEAAAARQAAAGAVTPQTTQQVNMPGPTLASYAAPHSVPDGSNGPQQSFSLPTSQIQLPGQSDNLTTGPQFDQSKYISNLAGNPQTAAMVPGAQAQFAQQQAQLEQHLQTIRSGQVKLSKDTADAMLAKVNAVGQLTMPIKQMEDQGAPPQQIAAAYQQVVATAQQNGLDTSNLPPQYVPGIGNHLVEQGMAVKDAIGAQHSAATAAETQRHNLVTEQPKPGVDVPFSPEVMNQKVQLKETRPVTAPLPGSGPNDAKDIAAGIISGKLPPSTKGLYRNAGPVLAELGRQGYNLQQAESDWNAVQKHVATLNGSQQERLRQSISSAGEMVDKVDQLYSEWKQVGAESGIKVFNRAALATAKNLPGRAGAVAQALDAQIADLTADLGNIYMGGNSPTERALELAGKSLQSDWNDQSFSEGVKQIRANVKIRQNSMANSQPAGLSGNTNYGPGNGQSAPQEGGMTITLPSGKTVKIN